MELRDRRLTENRRELVLDGIFNLFTVLYEVDLQQDSYYKYRANEQISEFVESFTSANECLKAISHHWYQNIDEARIAYFFDTKTWPEQLKDRDVVSLDARGIISGWIRQNLIVFQRNDNGVPTHVLVAIQNINEEIKWQLQNNEMFSMQTTNDIMSNAGIGLWHIILKDGCAPRMQVNHRMAELMGMDDCDNMTDEEVYASWYQGIVPEAMPSVENSFQVMIDGSFSENTYQWMHPKKKLTYMRCGGTATTLMDGTHVLSGYHADVTEIIRKEERLRAELEVAYGKAKAASKAKSSFLLNMSHDIRTPMNAIIGYTNLLEKNLGHTDVEVCKDYLDKIKYASDFLLSLINNVLEMSKIESGKVTLDLAPCSTSAVSHEIEHIYADLMQKKQIKFSQEAAIRTPYVYGDKLKLNEIFLNLISNAYKYTPAGGSVHASLLELPCDRPGWIFLQTKISDTGIGISADYLPKIFEEFTRERNSTDAKIQGTGLGMPIVKKLVELMDGTITVESEQGKGSTFVVTIPHKIAAPPQEYAVPKVEVQLEKLAGKRILLAEDNEINAEIATMILSDVGIKVDVASDGVECLDMLQRAESGYYNLILMDIQMPNMDGYQAARSIRNLTDSAKRSIPIIAMTANAFEEDRKNAMAVGMNEHLAKPIDVKKLLEMLTQYLVE